MLKELGFYKGVNLGGWLSQCDYSDERLDHFIEARDFEKIDSWGLDHVRIPVDYNVFENEDGSYKPEGFQRLIHAITLAQKHDLNTIIDLHKTAGYSFDSGEGEGGFFEDEELQERFYRLWEEFARRFGGYGNHIAFELLNEVTDKAYIKTWNKIVKTCIKRIRAITKDTIILVGSWGNNSVSAVKDLNKPFDDRVIYNFHCYDPFPFTHQGAYWVDCLDRDARVSFAESGTSVEYFEELFASAIKAAADNNNTELYCGEYGVIDNASPEDALKWYQTIHKVFEKYGIAHAAWSYKEMDFGLSDPRMDNVRAELIKVL